LRHATDIEGKKKRRERRRKEAKEEDKRRYKYMIHMYNT
jgi:hypothetical protein